MEYLLNRCCSLNTNAYLFVKIFWWVQKQVVWNNYFTAFEKRRELSNKD